MFFYNCMLCVHVVVVVLLFVIFVEFLLFVHMFINCLIFVLGLFC